MTVHEIAAYLAATLAFHESAAADNAVNGLQVGRAEKPVGRVAVAVDACLETFRRAGDAGADLLIVHHGLFWGHEQPLVGAHYERIRWLVEHDMALFAAHLPIDRHPRLGNNAVMARVLGLVDVEPFGRYKGLTIGVQGRLPQPTALPALVERLFGTVDQCLSILPMGPPLAERVGIVSGGAPDAVDQAIAAGLDAYVTGDASHTVYHQCVEAGINVVSAGHYATETWGVRAVGDDLAERFGLDVEFIDVPTGL